MRGERRIRWQLVLRFGCMGRNRAFEYVRGAKIKRLSYYLLLLLRRFTPRNDKVACCWLLVKRGEAFL